MARGSTHRVAAALAVLAVVVPAPQLARQCSRRRPRCPRCWPRRRRPGAWRSPAGRPSIGPTTLPAAGPHAERQLREAGGGGGRTCPPGSWGAERPAPSFDNKYYVNRHGLFTNAATVPGPWSNNVRFANNQKAFFDQLELCPCMVKVLTGSQKLLRAHPPRRAAVEEAPAGLASSIYTIYSVLIHSLVATARMFLPTIK
jgi:hypothetical protein